MLNSLKNNRFVKNVAVLLSGNIVAQLIPLIASLFIAKIYSPEHFSTLTYFVSISGVLSSIIGGRYELAIMLPKEEYQAIQLFQLSFYINLIISICVGIASILFTDTLSEVFGNEGLKLVLPYLAIFTFLTGLYQSGTFLLNRQGNYKNLSLSIISKSISTALLKILLGILERLQTGLIVGTIFGQIIASSIVSIKALKILFKSKLSIISLKTTAIEYKDFPLKSSPSILINLLANQGPLFLLGFLFKDNNYIGNYGFVIVLLNIPLSTIGKSVSQVFYQEANQNPNSSQLSLFLKTTKYMSLMVLIPSIVIFFFGEELFNLVFGNKWLLAGTFAEIFIFYYAVRFVFSSQSTLLTTNRKMGTELLFNLSFLITQIVSVYLGAKYGNFNNALTFMSISGMLLFVTLGFLLFKTAQEADNEKAN